MAVALLFAPGCSLGGDEEPRPAGGAPREIADIVERLERATAERDFRTICQDLLTRAARERAGGGDCVRLTREAAEGVRRPRITIRAIRVEGDRAEVEVRTRATGQAVVEDVLDLRREDGEWRVEALAG